MSVAGSRHPLPLQSLLAQASRREELWPTAVAMVQELAPPVPANPLGTIERDRYEMWLSPLVLEDVTATTLYVSAPAEIRGWLHGRYDRQLRRVAMRVLGHSVASVVFVDYPPVGERAAFRSFADLEAREDVAA